MAALHAFATEYNDAYKVNDEADENIAKEDQKSNNSTALPLWM